MFKFKSKLNQRLTFQSFHSFFWASFELLLTTIVASLFAAFIIAAPSNAEAKTQNQAKAQSKEIRILVFQKINGFAHAGNAAMVDSFVAYAKSQGTETHHTKDSLMFNDDTLKTYDAVVFINTNYRGGRLLDSKQERAFENYIHKGGGFVGIHSAIPLNGADMEAIWPWYAKLFGARFEPPHLSPTQEGDLVIEDTNHISTRGLPSRIRVLDEWYPVLVNPRTDTTIHILASVDGQSVSKEDRFTVDRPISWYREFEGGRSWVTLAGHSLPAFKNKDYLKHIYGGTLYAAGVVYGCMDVAFKEFDAKANRDDGSCKTLALSLGENREESIQIKQSGNHSITIMHSSKDPYLIEIFSFSGSRLAKQNALGRKTYTFKGFKNEGVYFVKFTSGQNVTIKKFISSNQVK